MLAAFALMFGCRASPRRSRRRPGRRTTTRKPGALTDHRQGQQGKNLLPRQRGQGRRGRMACRPGPGRGVATLPGQRSRASVSAGATITAQALMVQVAAPMPAGRRRRNARRMTFGEAFVSGLLDAGADLASRPEASRAMPRPTTTSLYDKRPEVAKRRASELASRALRRGGRARRNRRGRLLE